MFNTPNVHSVASSAMSAAFRNAAQPLGPVQPAPMSTGAVQRLAAAWSALVLLASKYR
jgi:hypothetical protein